ncbi:MAG: diacylglycerol kinase family protein [Deltaproteobacteria bacterium]|nr:diacylglycerol kinase family protein [Deltaproteobacteria bacterium]
MLLCFANPNARMLKGQRHLREQLQSLLPRETQIEWTHSIEDLFFALKRAELATARLIIVIGGDGTLHQVINALLEKLGLESAHFPPIFAAGGGTMDFVARRLRASGHLDIVPFSPLRALDRLSHSIKRGEKLSRVLLPSLLIDFDEGASRRLGFAIAIGGIGAQFFRAYYNDPDPSVGTMLSIVSRAIVGLPWRSPTASLLFNPSLALVAVDGKPLPTAFQSAIHAGAFPIALGHVFRLFPLAMPHAFHVQAGRMAPWAVIASLPRLVLGKPLRGQFLYEGRAHCLQARSLGQPFSPVIDGEAYPPTRLVRVSPGPALPFVLPPL